ncbi:endospore germination permease [Paenibacillus sp. IB182496]|uniref:Endospore germination permease n=1 Tax=Paenibacillus sabuli TaxID=2772509 RepID=A0A927BR24_9BACL|nr:endospore germination permease [Paenibacillus sabuli]MBD2844190.1 endospore germination permease [Paenibacillus sabuli]
MHTGLTVRGFTVLTIMFTIGTSILIAPAGLAMDAAQDAWLAALLGLALNLAMVGLYIAIGERMGERHLVAYCAAVLGRWAGWAVGLAFVGFFYLLSALMIGDLGYFLTTQTLTQTPIEVLQLLFICFVCYAVKLGLRAYTNTAEIFLPWIVGLFLVMIFPVFSRMTLTNFEPVFEKGILPILQGGWHFYGLQEMVVLLMIYAFVPRHGRRSGFVWGTFIGGLFLILTTLGALAVVGPDITANQLFPAYTLAKNINIGHFLERVEGIMIFIWVLTIFFKIVICFHGASRGFAFLFGLHNEKPLVVPMAVGLVVLSLMCYPNTIYIQSFITKVWTPFATLFMVVLPLLLLAVSLLRNAAAKLREPGDAGSAG